MGLREVSSMGREIVCERPIGTIGENGVVVLISIRFYEKARASLLAGA